MSPPPLPCERSSVVSNSLQPHGLYSPCNSPSLNTGVGSRSLLQGIFPTQGSNPGLPHCRRILYQLSHQGTPAPSYLLYSQLCLGVHFQNSNWHSWYQKWAEKAEGKKWGLETRSLTVLLAIRISSSWCVRHGQSLEQADGPNAKTFLRKC